MSKAAQRRVLEAGEWLFREGDEGDSAYLIEGGMLKSYARRMARKPWSVI